MQRKPNMSPTEFAEWFWSKLNTAGSCWEWTGCRNGDGYGEILRDRRPQKAHRIAWELTHGPIPGGSHVLHRCDNPPCCNQEHLWLGTPLDNARDKERKGRGNHAKGDAHGSKLHPERVARGDRNGRRLYPEVWNGRGWPVFRGEAHGRAILTEADIPNILAAVAGGESPGSIAARYGVSRGAIDGIRRGRTWRHITCATK